MREVVWRMAYCFYLTVCHGPTASRDGALYWKLKERLKANLEWERKNCRWTKLGGKCDLSFQHSPRGLLRADICWPEHLRVGAGREQSATWSSRSLWAQRALRPRTHSAASLMLLPAFYTGSEWGLASSSNCPWCWGGSFSTFACLK